MINFITKDKKIFKPVCLNGIVEWFAVNLADHVTGVWFEQPCSAGRREIIAFNEFGKIFFSSLS